MALLKTIYTEDNTGCAATYWKICDVEIDAITKHGSLELMGYVSSEAFSNGKNPLIIKKYEIRHDLFDVYFSESVLNTGGINIYTQGYQYIKVYSEEFADAEEVA